MPNSPEEFKYRFPQDFNKLNQRYIDLEKEGFKIVKKPEDRHYISRNFRKDDEIVVFQRMNRYNVISERRGIVFNIGLPSSMAIDIILLQEYRYKDENAIYGCFLDKIRVAYSRKVLSKEDLRKRLSDRASERAMRKN